MNSAQRLWWHQAESDWQLFAFLRDSGQPVCHSLHYLQMASEKVAKAYFWRENEPPPKEHSAFVQFIRLLSQSPTKSRKRLANLFEFARFQDFRSWTGGLLTIAYELEHLQPQLANEGPNCEYPWPHSMPRHTPVAYSFPIWTALMAPRGRDLLRLISISIRRFPELADL